MEANLASEESKFGKSKGRIPFLANGGGRLPNDFSRIL